MNEHMHGDEGRRVAVVGAGHVGLVTAACLSAIGHDVAVLDVDAARIARLRAGETPFLEPGLEALLRIGRDAGRLHFDTDPARALVRAFVTFLCVNTPNRPDGAVDLSAVISATQTVAGFVPAGCVLVNRTTAPVGTARYLRSIVAEQRGGDIEVVSNPEFLAEGTAVRDFLIPDRIVIGALEERAAERLVQIYKPIVDRLIPADVLEAAEISVIPESPVPIVHADPATGELTKYAANAFLAVKISFINEIASIAEEVGADVHKVSHAIGLDRRIGPHFLRAGIGWGGSCFPKDIVALRGMAESRGVAARMLRAANDVNEEQRRWVVRKLLRHLTTLVGRRVALLGLSFKPNTDDLRSAPAIGIAMELARLGARIRAYDPAITSVPEELEGIVQLAADPYTLAEGAEAIVVLTEWPAFADLDLEAVRARVAEPLLIDGRNVLNPARAAAAGFTYVSVGRGERSPADIGNGSARDEHGEVSHLHGGASRPPDEHPRVASARERRRVSSRWLGVLSIAVAVAALSLAVDVLPNSGVGDRLAHAAAYACLGAAVLSARRVPRRRHDVIGIVVLVIGLGYALELLQGLVGRDPDPIDGLADALGVVAGVAVAARWATLRARAPSMFTRKTRSGAARSAVTRLGTGGWS